MTVENWSYRCPHCTTRLEVVHVKFRLASVAVVSGCPSCMIIIPDERHSSNGVGGARKPPNLAELARSVFRMMEALNSRVRYALAFLIAALITAALLRHVVHVYAASPAKEFARARCLPLLLFHSRYSCLREGAGTEQDLLPSGGAEFPRLQSFVLSSQRRRTCAQARNALSRGKDD